MTVLGMLRNKIQATADDVAGVEADDIINELEEVLDQDGIGENLKQIELMTMAQLVILTRN